MLGFEIFVICYIAFILVCALVLSVICIVQDIQHKFSVRKANHEAAVEEYIRNEMLLARHELAEENAREIEKC